MTVIARDGKTLAADKRMVFGTFIRSTTKIFHIYGQLVGFSGDTAFGLQMVDWIKRGADPLQFPDAQRTEKDWCGVLVISKDKRIFKYEQTPQPLEIHDKHFAIGSGRDYAMAAMHLGKSAQEAVEIACYFDSACGNGIDTLVL